MLSCNLFYTLRDHYTKGQRLMLLVSPASLLKVDFSLSLVIWLDWWPASSKDSPASSPQEWNYKTCYHTQLFKQNKTTKIWVWLGVVAQALNPNTGKVEAEQLRSVWSTY